MVDVGGVDPFPSTKQSQHFYGFKTDVVCVNTVTSLGENSGEQLCINSRQNLQVYIAATHWTMAPWIGEEKWEDLDKCIFQGFLFCKPLPPNSLEEKN